MGLSIVAFIAGIILFIVDQKELAFLFLMVATYFAIFVVSFRQWANAQDAGEVIEICKETCKLSIETLEAMGKGIEAMTALADTKPDAKKDILDLRKKDCCGNHKKKKHESK